MKSLKIITVHLTFLIMLPILSLGQHDFRQAQWGMTPRQIHALEMAANSRLAEQSATYNTSDFYGQPAYVQYFYTPNGEFYEATAFPNARLSSDLANQQFHDIQQELVGQYGKPMQYTHQGQGIESYLWENDRARIIHDLRVQEWRTWYFQNSQQP